MGKFYPSDYYSFSDTRTPAQTSAWRLLLQRARTDTILTGRGLLGHALAKVKQDYFDHPWQWFIDSGVTTASRILDVGCGSGNLLHSLHAQGFLHLTGVDPFCAAPVRSPRLNIVKATVHDITEQFDLVMAHHSMEHMPDIETALNCMSDLTKPGARLLIRIPIVADSWKRYGVFWAELDAPRHLVLPTLPGFEALVRRVGGMTIRRKEFDTFAFEIEGSEVYERGKPLMQAGMTIEQVLAREFTADERAAFRRRAEALNADGTAGRVALYLQRR